LYQNVFSKIHCFLCANQRSTSFDLALFIMWLAVCANAVIRCCLKNYQLLIYPMQLACTLTIDLALVPQ